MRVLTLSVLLLSLVLAALPAAAADDPIPARVVVSPLDSGINPYHEAFQVEQSQVTQDVLDAFGIEEDHVLELGESYQADVEAGVWDDVDGEELYHFAGTNIIATDTTGSAIPFLPDSSGDTHGVGVAGSVAAGNPDAIIFFVEGTGTAAEELAFNHPEVDIVTTSYGAPTAVPLALNSYEGVVENGKAHFGASPNDPSLASVDGTSGPWWSISMAGYAEGEGDGKEITSGTSPEFVGDFTQRLPYCQFCTADYSTPSGTSFATPLAAGVASRVLLEARRALGHEGGMADGVMIATDEVTLTTWDLRRAMQAGAVMPSSTSVGLTLPTLPAADYAVVGWGAITPDPELDVVDRALGFLGVPGFEAPEDKPADQCDFMNNHFDARLYLWDSNPTSESFGSFDPAGYLYC